MTDTITARDRLFTAVDQWAEERTSGTALALHAAVGHHAAEARAAAVADMAAVVLATLTTHTTDVRVKGAVAAQYVDADVIRAAVRSAVTRTGGI